MCSGKRLSKARERIQSVSRLRTFDFSNRIPHIGSTRNYGMVLKLERLSYLSGWSFGFGSLIGLGYLSLILLLRTDE